MPNSTSPYLLTVAAKNLTTSQLEQVQQFMTEHDFHINATVCLSEKNAFETNETKTSNLPTPPINIAYQYHISNATNDLAYLRQSCLELADKLQIDVAIQADDEFCKRRKLVCFDMDSTLIEQEVIVELAKRYGIGEQVAEITESAMRGEIDFTQSFTQRVALLKGLSTDVLEDIAKNLVITEGAATLVSTLKSLGYHTALISGGFTYFAHYVQNQLGIDEVYANVLDIKDGVVTGKVKPPIVDAVKKAEILQTIAKDLKIDLQQVVAVGDGANDLQMIALSGLGVAFRAKPLVKQSAKQSISNLGLDGVLYLLGVADNQRKQPVNH